MRDSGLHNLFNESLEEINVFGFGKPHPHLAQFAYDKNMMNLHLLRADGAECKFFFHVLKNCDETFDTEFTNSSFTKVIFAHTSNDVVWDNIGLLALGTNNRGIIDVTANGDITWTNSVFQDIDVTTLLSNCTFDGSKWIGCNEVDSGGASMLGCCHESKRKWS